jgi:hypothetical protein
MEGGVKKKPTLLKKLVLGGIILLVVGAVTAWFIITREFEDTAKQEAVFTVNAMDLIKEFQVNDTIANKKYADKIMTVKGRVSEFENADTTINIKMIDTLTDALIVFAFQKENLIDVKKLKEGDSVSIKGSCSGGTYSEILETEFVNFKRCVINK